MGSQNGFDPRPPKPQAPALVNSLERNAFQHPPHFLHRTVLTEGAEADFWSFKSGLSAQALKTRSVWRRAFETHLSERGAKKCSPRRAQSNETRVTVPCLPLGMAHGFCRRHGSKFAMRSASRVDLAQGALFVMVYFTGFDMGEQRGTWNS